jgi:thiamine pyrophosphokinase
MWHESRVRVCTDGGANSLLKYSQKFQGASLPSPHWIIGDLDSLIEEAPVYYSQTTEIIKDPDQDSTDLDKCLSFLATEGQSPSSSTSSPIFVFGALGGGRFDQVFANIHSMHKFSHISICLLSDSRYAFLLTRVKVRLFWILNLMVPAAVSFHFLIRKQESLQQDFYGILVGGNGRKSIQSFLIRSSGLGEKDVLKFGGLFSSSNRFDNGNLVKIRTSQVVMFTVEYSQ